MATVRHRQKLREKPNEFPQIRFPNSNKCHPLSLLLPWYLQPLPPTHLFPPLSPVGYSEASQTCHLFHRALLKGDFISNRWRQVLPVVCLEMKKAGFWFGTWCHQNTFPSCLKLTSSFINSFKLGKGEWCQPREMHRLRGPCVLYLPRVATFPRPPGLGWGNGYQEHWVTQGG